MNVLYSLFDESARQYSHRWAVKHVGGAKLTYDELKRCVLELSDHLSSAGLTERDHVGVFLPNGLPFMIAYWAVQRIGATAVLIPSVAKPWDIKRIQDSCDIGWWLSDFSRLPYLVDGVDGTTFHASSLADICYVYRLTAPKPDLSTRAAVILPTSGSTGAVKPVMIGSAALAWNAIAYAKDVGIDETDRGLVLLPLTGAFAHTTQMIAHLLTGGELLLGPELFFFPHHVLGIVAQEAPTLLGLVPSAFKRILASLNEPLAQFPKTVLAGEHTDRQIIEDCKRLLPACQIIRAYGLSEAGPRVAQGSVVMQREIDDAVGQPLAGVDIRIRDEEGFSVPPNTVGHIEVRTPSMMLGYYRDPFATSTAIQDGWLSTGDIGSVDQYGNLKITGRRKNMVIKSGLKIYPEEIEAFFRTWPGVANAAVFARETVGETPVLVAYIIGENTSSLTEERLLDACRRNLTPVKVPDELYIVDSLPTSPGGKLDRKQVIQDDAGFKNYRNDRRSESLIQ